MAGVTPATLRDLAAPTPPNEIKQRQGPGGRMLSYIDARHVYDTLDRVVGPENWQSAFQPTGIPAAVRGGIGILVLMEDPIADPKTGAITVPGRCEWVWKWDVGVASDIEPEKGAHSEAIKRAAVHWGIARDLYGSDPVGVAQQQAPRPPVAQRPPMQQQAQYQQPQVQTAGQPQVPWMCPIHNQWQVKPAGFSQRTQKPYAAFFVCPVPNCDQKPPRGTVVPPQLAAAATPPQPQQYEQPPLPTPPSGFDDPSRYQGSDGTDLGF